jgi:outer membrane protein TolC
MTLSQAEMMAIKNDSLSKKANAQRDSFLEQSVAANTWPDPKLNMGIVNISANSMDFAQEPMTQAVIGLTQMFPPWGAVGAKSDQMMNMSEAMGFAAKNQNLMTISGVRKSWMSVYFQYHAKRLIQESLDVFGQFINVAKFQYRQGRGNQQDVIRAQLEQNLLEDKLAETSAKYDVAVATLSKWLGKTVLPDELDMQFPKLPELLSQGRIEGNLENHPTVLQRKMRINSAENGVNFASSQLRPGWALKVQYGLRADAPTGMGRDDFLTAMLTFDLPLFTGKRQDRMVAAMKSEVESTLQDLDDWRREIKMRYEKSVAMYTRADERVQLYEGSVLPHSKQNTEATLKAYQSGVTDFNVLVRARLTELKSQLQFFKLRVDRAEAQIDLLYYAGAAN